MEHIEYKQITDQLSDSKVLVVGGGGFIGSALSKKLNTLKAHVISLVCNGIKKRDSLPNVTTIAADIREHTSLKKALANYSFDYIFNLGGYIDHSPYLEGGRNVVDVHYTGMLNLLNQVFTPSLKKFVQIGSSDEYGNEPSPQSENLREAPISPYSAAKVGATHLIQALSRTEGLPGVVVRLFLVYGPGQNDRRFLPQIIKGCLDGKTFPTSSGKQLRDFCYVEDVVEGLILAAVSPKVVGHVINLASGIPIAIRDVIEKVVELIGNGHPDFGAYPYRPGENMKLYADVSLAHALLNWQATTSLEDGLGKTISWYAQRFKS
jgi:nucleoside-diphosphate-sugar epimerase